IEPDRQGQGLGGKLLDVVFDRLDATHMPAYLETSTEGNVAWYRHHGFELQHEVRPAAAGPPIWTMWRGGGGGRSPRVRTARTAPGGRARGATTRGGRRL